MKTKIRNRLLYRGEDCEPDARYELSAYADDKEMAFRIWDVIGGDALVFLTPRQVARLISDLLPYTKIPMVKGARK